MCLLLYASVVLMYILANTKCHLQNVYYAAAYVFLVSLRLRRGAVYHVSHSWSWSCSAFPCRQSSHWFPDGHVQVRDAGSVPTVVKIDSYLVVFIERRGRRALYNRRVLGGSTGLFKTSSDSCFPWQELAPQQGTKAGILPLLFSLLADNKPHSRHAKELEDKQPKQRNAKWGLVLGSLVFAFACKGEADTTEDAAALCQCSRC